MKKYPKQIYIQKEKDGDSEYFLANDKKEEVNDGEFAIYSLVKVGKKKTETILDF